MATDAEKEELAEAYERYKAQSKRLKEAIRQRVKEIVEDEYAREDQKNKAEFGRQLGLSNLSVRERQEVLKTRDWGTYKAFMDAAGMPTSARFTPVNLPDEDVTDDYTVSVRPAPNVPGVPYPLEVRPDATGVPGTSAWVDLSHSPTTGEFTVAVIAKLTSEGTLADYVARVGEDAYRTWQGRVVDALPEDEVARYRAENGLDDQ